MKLYSNEYSEKEILFFNEIIKKYSNENFKKIDVIVVAHILPDAINFLGALDSIFNVKKVFAKEKSINQRVYDYLSATYDIEVADRDKLQKPEFVDDYVDTSNEFVLLDIGGYFSKVSNKIKKKYGDQFLGVIEDTENGFSKYLKEGINFPFIQVARSDLKDNEDFLVGQAISFSAESIFRENGILLNGLSVGVIGFGKIGSGISYALRSKQSIVSVYDINPIKITHAYSRGFLPKNKDILLSDSDIICLASGKKSIEKKDFAKIKNGAYIFTVTSSDDEIEINYLKEVYKEKNINNMVTRYERGDKYFYLLNKGNAINFVHGTTVSTFILLVQAGIISSVLDLYLKKEKNFNYSLSSDTQKYISDVWLNIFVSKYRDIIK